MQSYAKAQNGPQLHCKSPGKDTLVGLQLVRYLPLPYCIGSLDLQCGAGEISFLVVYDSEQEVGLHLENFFIQGVHRPQYSLGCLLVTNSIEVPIISHRCPRYIAGASCDNGLYADTCSYRHLFCCSA